MSKIALLPGGFKPPHAGHYNMAKWLSANTGADTTIIFVGPKEREGITQEMSLKLWELYTQNDSGLEIRKAGVSPVRDVYDFIEQDAPEGSTVYLGMGEKDISDKRFANIPKFAEPRGITFETKLVPPQAGGVSGTEMRGFIKMNDKPLFQYSLPDHLSNEQKEQAWSIVTGLDEDLYNPEDKVLDYMKSNDWKRGKTKKDDIPRAYKYKRGGMYNAASGQGGAGTMYETLEGDKSNKIFVMKSPHTPKGQKWDHIGFILNDGRLRDMSGHRGSDKAPETYKYEDTEELFQMPKDKNEAIKKGLYAEKPLPKEITIPDTIACDIKDPNKKAENCGSFVKIVLSNNGIETTKSNWMGDIYNSLNEASSQGKTLHVYDFDDTIARVKANIKVYITSPNGEYNKELLIPAEKFPEESKELEARLGNLEIEYDFKEFEKQIGDAIVNAGVVNKLKNSLSKPDIKTTILTARSIGHPVTKYLKEKLGLAAYVVPLGLQVGGKVTGQDKANWIENHINKGYNTIYFIDDSEENRVAVEALKDKYPDTKITVENPYEVSEMMMGMMNKQEKAKHAKNMKRLSKDLKKINKGNQYVKVPKYIKGTLTRKLSEMEDYELKYWALYADLVKKLDAPDAEETYARLRPKLTGEKQKALDYFYHTYFKEDSPEKLEEKNCGCGQTPCITYGLNEVRFLSKGWWSNIIKQTILTEGGAAGHMNHPFDDRDLTFDEMKEIVRLSLQGKLNIEADVTEKTDGQNLAVTYKNGKVGAARNKATIREPMDINAIASKFEGRGDIEKAFTFSMRDLENALKTLAPETLNTIFQNGKRFLNIEIIYPATKNVITYGPKAYIQFHGVDEYNLETATKGESFPEFAPELQKLIAGVNANIQQTFEIIPPKIITTKAVRDFDQKESYYISKINKLQKEFNLKDFDEVVMYHQKWWEKKINEEFPRATDEEKNALVRRWAYFEKTFRLRKIQDEETRQKAIDFDKTNFQQQNKENVYQFEKIFLELGADVLSNIDNYLAVNPKESVKELRQDIQKVIKQIQSSNDLEVLNKLKYQLQRIEDMGGFDKLVPSEGIVFIYKGKTYKITGLFAAVNQLLGLTRYV